VGAFGLEAALVVTGVGHVLDPEVDPRRYLKVKKLRKFMGAQDRMAVVAAGLALADAGLDGAPQGEEVGLYAAVGALPFRRDDIDLLLEGALDDAGRFSMPAYAARGYEAVNPLLTFRCLSNMPAFHVSSSFDVQGPYLTTYPGPGQLYAALEEAALALAEGRVRRALVLGVAHQDNFLVRQHVARLAAPAAGTSAREAGATLAGRLPDGAGCLVLETAAAAAARGARTRARLTAAALDYAAHDPFEEGDVAGAERFSADVGAPLDLGPASLPVALALAFGAGEPAAALEHTLAARDGFRASSAWERAS